MERFATIEEYIDSFHPKLNDLILQSDGDAIVSGSTAMYFCMKAQGVTPEFIPGDLDIFITGRANEPFYFLFRELCQYRSSFDVVRNNYPVSDHDHTVWKYNIDGKEIDLVYLKPEWNGRPDEYINEKSDLDICKCWFDGKRLFTKYDFSNKTCELNIVYRNSRNVLLEDLVPYFNKIRTFNHNSDPLPNEYDWYNYLKRIRKYTKRGFTIITKNCKINPQQFRELVAFEINFIRDETIVKFLSRGIKLDLWMYFYVEDGISIIEKDLLIKQAEDFIAQIKKTQ